MGKTQQCPKCSASSSRFNIHKARATRTPRGRRHIQQWLEIPMPFSRRTQGERSANGRKRQKDHKF
jgi:hypothetical protein